MYKRGGNHVYIYDKFLKFLSSVAQSLTKITHLVAKKNGQEIATELHQITPDAFPPNCTETSQLRNICHPHLWYFLGGTFSSQWLASRLSKQKWNIFLWQQKNIGTVIPQGIYISHSLALCNTAARENGKGLGSKFKTKEGYLHRKHPWKIFTAGWFTYKSTTIGKEWKWSEPSTLHEDMFQPSIFYVRSSYGSQWAFRISFHRCQTVDFVEPNFLWTCDMNF